MVKKGFLEEVVIDRGEGDKKMYRITEAGAQAAQVLEEPMKAARREDPNYV